MLKIVQIVILFFSLNLYCQKGIVVYFDFNEDKPNNLSIEKLNLWIENNKTVEVTKILGFCDSVDDSKYNIDLASRRINSVLKLLKDNNILVTEKVVLQPLGKDFNFSKIQSENRKVEIYYNEPKLPVIQGLQEEGTLLYENFSEIVKTEKSELAQKFDKAKKGDLIAIKNINFYFNSEKIIEKSIPLLDELFKILEDNPKLKIEIRGHICCNPNTFDTKLSYRRAIVIFKYLIKKGIPVKRLAYKGIGSNDPIYPLPERNEKERAANRRVEILIVEK